jgi:hypothetical protein
MAARDTPPFSLERLAQFERFQALRPVMMQSLADKAELWRYCENAACTRARSCRRRDGACFTAFMQALPDEERVMFRYALELRHAGLEPGAALAMAQSRVADEIARLGG